MHALTFARRFLYNTSELSRDGVSAVADQMSWIYGDKNHLQEALPKIEGLRGGGDPIQWHVILLRRIPLFERTLKG